MPIEVHCPNPDCACVHLVKNKYAGMRGKCPACASWMYVPRVGMMPSMVVSRPEGLEEAAGAAAAAPSAKPVGEAPARPAPAARAESVSLHEVAIDEPPFDEPPKKKKAAPRPVEEEEEALPEAALDDEEPEAKRPFRKLPVFLLLLAILSLGAVSAAPFLEGPSAKPTGDLQDLKLVQPEGIDKEKTEIVALSPTPAVLLMLLALLMGLATRQWTFLPIALTYIAALLVAGGMFMVAIPLQKDLETINTKIPREVERMKDSGKRQGDYEASMGLQLPVAVAGVAAGAVFLVLAAMAMHRRWWAGVLCFVVLTLPMAVLVVWAFHKEVGLDVPAPPF